MRRHQILSINRLQLLQQRTAEEHMRNVKDATTCLTEMARRCNESEHVPYCLHVVCMRWLTLLYEYCQSKHSAARIISQLTMAGLDVAAAAASPAVNRKDQDRLLKKVSQVCSCYVLSACYIHAFMTC